MNGLHELIDFMKLKSQLSSVGTAGDNTHGIVFYYNIVYLFHAILQSSRNTM